MKDYRFLIALALVIGVAFWLPSPALLEGFFSLATLSSIGVFGIFFLYGIKVQRNVFMEGIKNFRLHILVQITTFVIFPLLILPFGFWLQSPFHHNLWLGVLFLAALPSTLSTSVVMVSMAKGNVAAAIFNASLSGLLGILLTPLWMGLFMNLETGENNFGTVFVRLLLEIVLPVSLGLALQKPLHWIPVRYAKPIRILDKGVVLLIVYRSFAGSFHNNLFADTGIMELSLLILAMLVLLLVVFKVIGIASNLLRFIKSDRITALICGTQKSLIHGSVFSNVLFGHLYYAGVLLLPLMIFHTLQILFFSVISTKHSQNDDT